MLLRCTVYYTYCTVLRFAFSYLLGVDAESAGHYSVTRGLGPYSLHSGYLVHGVQLGQDAGGCSHGWVGCMDGEDG